MKTAAVLTLLIVSAYSNLAAVDGDLQTTLSSKYEHTILILRNPVESKQQQYSASGSLLNGGKEAPWTVAGALEVSKLEVTPNMLSIEGKRQMLVFDEKRNAMLPYKAKKKEGPAALVQILLDAPLRSSDEAEAIMHRVFALNDDELIESVPEYWRPFLRKHKSKQQGAGIVPTLTGSNEGTRIQDPDKVYHVDGKAVTAPKPVYTPEPSFSVEAKHTSFQGVVVLTGIVDATGQVTRVQIVRPLGMGLDEKAVEVVQKWKFKPATRDGKPVAVEMGLEIAFNLY